MTEFDVKRKLLNSLIVKKGFNLSDEEVIAESKKLEEYITKNKKWCMADKKTLSAIYFISKL